MLNNVIRDVWEYTKCEDKLHIWLDFSDSWKATNLTVAITTWVQMKPSILDLYFSLDGKKEANWRAINGCK